MRLTLGIALKKTSPKFSILRGRLGSHSALAEIRAFSRLYNGRCLMRALYDRACLFFSVNNLAKPRIALRRVRLKVPSEIYSRAMISRFGTPST